MSKSATADFDSALRLSRWLCFAETHGPDAVALFWQALFWQDAGARSASRTATRSGRDAGNGREARFWLAGGCTGTPERASRTTSAASNARMAALRRDRARRS